MMDQRAYDIHESVTVRNHHTLRPGGCATGVINCEQVSLSNVGLSEASRRISQKSFVVEPAILLSFQRDESVDPSEFSANGIYRIKIIGVSTNHASTAVFNQISEVIGNQPVIDWNQDCAQLRYRIERFKLRVGIR